MSEKKERRKEVQEDGRKRKERKRGKEEKSKRKGRKEERKEKVHFFYILPLCIGCLKSYNHIQKQALLPECSTGRLMELTISS